MKGGEGRESGKGLNSRYTEYWKLEKVFFNESVSTLLQLVVETDSFLNALQRFVARREPVREIRSDHGTNLVGAEKELRRALEEMDNGSIQRSLCREFKADCVNA